MGKRVYLHVGWEKTGSSAVQVFCARNQEWLNERGFHYPLMGQLPQHVALYRNLKRGYTSLMQRSCDAIRAEIENCDQDTMIFSHESLHSCNPAMFAHIFEGCDVQIVAYTRRPDAAMISFFVTMTRFGQMPIHNMFKCIRTFAKPNIGHFDYYWSLRGFVSEFGREAVTVRHYDREELVGGQTVSDLMHVIGIDDLNGSKWPEDRANLSLDVDQFLVALRFAQSLKGKPPMRIRELTRRLCQALITNSVPDRSRSVEYFVPVSLRRRLINCWQGSFDALYSEFFDGRRLFDDESWVEKSREFEGIESQRLKELTTIVSEADTVPSSVRQQFVTNMEHLADCPLGC